MFSFWRKKYRYDNTRRYIRLPVSWPVKCESQGAPPVAGVAVGTTYDVSAGGVAVPVREKIPVGGLVRIEIYVPPLNRSLSVQGRVIRCSSQRGGGFELGVHFIQMDPKDRIALNEAIEAFYGPDHPARQRTTWWRRFT